MEQDDRPSRGWIIFLIAAVFVAINVAVVLLSFSV
jgi:hypothetical protein